MTDYLQPSIDPRHVETWPQILAVMKSLRAVDGTFTDGVTIGTDEQGRLTALPGAGGVTTWETIVDKPAAVQALASLVPQANRLAYYTGATQAALTALTAFARTLLDDPDAAAVRATLDVLSTGEVAAMYQPLDADLTAIAALATQAFGRGLLTLADLAALHALIGPASETAQGIIELATQAETDDGTDDLRAVTPLKLQTTIVNYARRLVERVHFQEAVAKGDPVYVSGVFGTQVMVARAQASSAATMPGVGVAAAAQGIGPGLVIRQGILSGVDTSAYAVGLSIYVGPTGGLTATRPGAPFSQRVGVVLRSHATVGVVGVNFAEVEEMNRVLDLATQAEVDAGTEANEYVSPLTLKATTFLASKILADRIAGSTYSTVQHYINTMTSPGLITGGGLSIISATQVRVATGTGMVRVADDNVSSLPFFDWAQTDFTVPNDDQVRFFGVIYNGGAPIVQMRTVENWDKDTEIPLGSALRGSTAGFFVLSNPFRTGDPITNVIQRFDANAPVLRDAYVGGLLIANVGTRNIAISAGKLWHRLDDNDFAAFDSSGASTFTTVYYNGTNWVYTGGVAQWPNAQYNDVASGLVAITGARYVNLWFYIGATGTNVFMVYGQAQHVLLADALEEAEPTFFPTNARPFVVLVGKLTFQNGGATPTQLASPFTAASLGFGAINNHNDLSGLQGGTAGEYYHLTAAEYAALGGGGGGPNGFESGTFVPVFTFVTPGNLSVSYVTQSGTYVRVGDLVYVNLELEFTPTHTTASGAVRITGFPFTAVASAGQFLQWDLVTPSPGFTFPTGTTMIFGRMINATTTMDFLCIGSGAIRANLTTTQFTSGSARRFLLSGCYKASTAAVGGSGLGGEVTTTATGNQTALAHNGTAVIRCNNASLLTIQGIVAGTAGQRLTIVSVGAGVVELAHENGSATAANRLTNTVTSAATPLAAGVGVAQLQYDATTARWRMVSHEQGAPITPTFAAGDYTGNGSMTWTVDSGDVTTLTYHLQGRQLTVVFDISTTTIGGTPSTNLLRTIPGGFTATKQNQQPCIITDSTITFGKAVVTAGATQIIFRAGAGAPNWTTGTNNKTVNGSITFEVT